MHYFLDKENVLSNLFGQKFFSHSNTTIIYRKNENLRRILLGHRGVTKSIIKLGPSNNLITFFSRFSHSLNTIPHKWNKNKLFSILQKYPQSHRILVFPKPQAKHKHNPSHTYTNLINLWNMTSSFASSTQYNTN